MLSTAYYFLQVLLCSAIMMGYYWMVLRNKKFHQYNRFYLLSVAILSWIVPLIKIQWTSSFSDNERVIRFLTVVADNNTELESVVKSKGFHWSMESLLSILYVSVGGFLLITMIHALYRIYQLLKKNPCTQIEDIFLIITQAKGTPFSFFRYIFWNDEIDIRSASGKQILQHELTHVQQRHSVDKMLIQLILVAGWFNPFFWLLKKEMEMIHEFIADKRSVRDGDTAALAKMLLTAVYPQQQFPLTHPFFFSPIKRRLQMLTNHKNPRFSYLRRLVALPLLAVLIVLFAFRSEQSRIDKPISVASVVENVVGDFRAHVIGDPNKVFAAMPYKSLALSKTYTIVVHPGHGGDDMGAVGPDGTKESELSLVLAKKIKELNTNPNIKVVLTRETDVFNTVVQVTEIAEKFSPDLFISVHANSALPIKSTGNVTNENPSKGAELYIASKDKAYDYANNYQLANMLGNMISNVVNPFLGIKSREKGIYVLQALKCPSVLIEAGFISNKEELKLLKDAEYQSKMALSILRGAELYLQQKEQNSEVMNTPVGEEKEAGTIGVEGRFDLTKPGHNFQWPSQWFKEGGYSKLDYLVLLDEEEIDIKSLLEIPINTIANITIFNGKDVLHIYGDKAKNGVLHVQTKRVSIPDDITKSSLSLSDFKAKHANIKSAFWLKDPLKLFITLRDGSEEIYNIENMESRKKAIDKYGQLPLASMPMTQASNPGIKVEKMTQVQVPVSFPGGDTAWRNYLNENLNREVPINNGCPPGKYIVKVSFVVDKTGKLSDLTLKNDPGYGTGAEVLRFFSKTPNWNPATINGKPVVSRFEKTVTFEVFEESDPLPTKDVVQTQTDAPPSFPGGPLSWSKYLQRNLDADIVKRKGGPPGKYTVQVTFIVGVDGKISNVRANNPGYGTKEEAIRMIAKGPNWKPALVKAKKVAAEHKLSITFFVAES